MSAKSYLKKRKFDLGSLHKVNRPEQVILFRLRTGHKRLDAHMYSTFKVGESEMCPCTVDILTAEHLLQYQYHCGSRFMATLRS